MAKLGARYIGLYIDYFTRFAFADTIAYTISANSIEILEIRVVEKIRYPRAVYSDNGRYFQGSFSSYLNEKGVSQFYTPIIYP